MIALIDADVIRYRVGFACEKKHYFVFLKDAEDYGYVASFENKTDLNKWLKLHDAADSVSVEERLEVDELPNCLHSVKLQIESILKDTQADDFAVYLSGKDNFRDKLVDYYKANRDRAHRPAHYENITKYLLDHWNAEVVDGIEADDALGVAQATDLEACIKHDDTFYGNTVICTIDKDLDNVPGWHYNFVKGDLYWVDAETATKNFYSQLLSGDAADNIPGLYKIAGVRCTAKMQEGLLYLDTEQEMWRYVVRQYLKAFNPSEEEYQDCLAAVVTKLREIGKLLWIQQSPGEDWEPPNEN